MTVVTGQTGPGPHDDLIVPHQCRHCGQPMYLDPQKGRWLHGHGRHGWVLCTDRRAPAVIVRVKVLNGYAGVPARRSDP